MAKTINQIDKTSDSFQVWIDKTNLALAAITAEVVTANSTAGYTAGNAYVVGIVSASNTLAANTIRGGNVTTTSTLNITSNVALPNTTNILVGNATINTVITSALIKVANSTSSVNVSAIDIKLANVVVNTAGLYVGSNTTVNSTYVSSNNIYADSLVANVLSITTGVANNFTANTIKGGNSSVTVALNISSGLVVPNSANILVGNSSINVSVTSDTIKVANSTSAVNVTAAALQTGISQVNGTVISVGANSFINATHVVANNLSSDNITGTTIQSGISKVNATVVAVGANSVINATHVAANNILANGVVSNTSSVDVGVANSFTANTLKGGNSTVTSALSITSNVSMPNTTNISVGNTTVNASLTNSLLSVANSTSSVNVNPNTLQAGISKVNTTVIMVGANSLINATHVVANNISSDNVSATVIQSGISKVNATVVTVGANTFMNATHVRANTVIAEVIQATTFNYNNSTVSDIISVANNTFTTNVIPSGLVTPNVTVGANTITVGTNVSINTTAVTADSLFLISGIVSSINVQTSGTTQQVVDSAALSSIRALDYVWTIADNNANGFQTSKLSVIHAGGASYHTEYGVVFSNTQLGVFATDTNATHVRVLFTPTVANSQLKAIRTAVDV